MATQKQRNLAAEHARLIGLPTEPAVNETGAQYRERVARALYEKGMPVYAHEALLNQRMSGDIFAHGPLDRGYGDSFITQEAEIAEGAYQESIKEGLLTRLVEFIRNPRSKE